MAGASSDGLERWLQPFLERLGHKARRRMCPLYVAGLIGPGDRKSVQPMAERFAPGDYDQLHHFVAAGVWDASPLEAELLRQADKLVGDSDAVLVIDDTALPKKGNHSVGIRRMLTEGAVRASDKRAQFVGVASYEDAGGLILRDLFNADDGGYSFDITWHPERLSASFHGRDLFAPVAAMLARGEAPPGRLRNDGADRRADWPDDLSEVVYIDHFGNASPDHDGRVRPRRTAVARLREPRRSSPSAPSRRS